MTLFERLRYALYAAVVGGATLSLVIALLSADAIAVLPPRAFDWIMSPLYGLAVYVVAFIFAPVLVESFPINRPHAKKTMRSAERLPSNRSIVGHSPAARRQR